LPATPIVTPASDDSLRLVFTRQHSVRLWLSGIDGSLPHPVTPEGTEAMFAGMPNADTFYWWERTSHLDSVLWRQTLSTGERTEVLRSEIGHLADAQLSPDGRRIVYVDADSVYILDLASGVKTLLLQGNWTACYPPPTGTPVPGPCLAYGRARWSPDGEHLVVLKTSYDRTVMVIVDPHDPAEVEVGDGELDGPYIAEWSPDSSAICLLGHYWTPSAFYVARAPDWKMTSYLKEELEPTPVPGAPFSLRGAFGCAWSSGEQLIVSIAGEEGAPAQVGTLRLSDSEFHSFELVSDDDAYLRRLIGAPGLGLAVTQAFVEGGDYRQAGQPYQVNAETGAIAPILEPGDWVVAVVDVGG
jgi:hypothetical protein